MISQAVDTSHVTITSIISRAATALTSATTAAEVLEARGMAADAYDAAKRMARLARAKEAHDEVIAAVYRAQADALLIESHAKARLADEYDAAQGRGEVATGRPKTLPDGNTSATVGDIGLTSKQIHEARQIRDAEKAAPGIAERALNERLAKGEEPTRAALKRDLGEAAKRTKAKQQAEWDRHQEEIRWQLNPKVRRVEEAKAANGSGHAAVVGAKPTVIAALEAERDELREENAALTTDIADLQRRLATFDDMAVQFEQGGFDAVKATLEERIRNLQRQVETESADKVAWKRKADFWKKQAIALGYVSPNSQTEMNEADNVEGYAPF